MKVCRCACVYACVCVCVRERVCVCACTCVRSVVVGGPIVVVLTIAFRVIQVPKSKPMRYRPPMMAAALCNRLTWRSKHATYLVVCNLVWGLCSGQTSREYMVNHAEDSKGSEGGGGHVVLPSAAHIHTINHALACGA